MRAILTNFGTTGDIEPFLALAVELRRHGHQPVLALSPYYASRVAQFDMEFQPIGPDTYQLQASFNAAWLTMPHLHDSVEHIRAIFAPLAAALPQAFYDLRAVCHTADVVISGATQPTGQMVHELTGIPFVSVQLTYDDKQGLSAFQQANASFINSFRTRLGLAPLRRLLTPDAHSSQLAIYALSRYVSPPPSDWPTHYHMPGFFFLEENPWQPEPALVEFLAAGEPPVVITFGSVTHGDPAALTDMLLAAVGLAGCRAIIQQGWSGLALRRLPPNVYSAGYIPHHWLFPRAACVVHHGGSGTSAAAFRAGVPSVVVPHMFDQPTWASLAQYAGCAGPPLPFAELTAARLGAAIQAVLTTPRYYRVAAVLREQILAEPGVKQARQLIEQLVDKVGLHQRAPAAWPQDGRRGEEDGAKISRRRMYQEQQRTRRRGRQETG